MWATVLALLAAACWGLAPVAAKLALNRVSPMIGMGIRSMVAACLVSLWLAATGHYRLTAGISLRTATWLLVEAVLATVVGDALYFYALKHGDAGQISLVMASAPLITLLTSVFFLGEPLTAEKLVGTAMILGGLVLISS